MSRERPDVRLRGDTPLPAALLLVFLNESLSEPDPTLRKRIEALRDELKATAPRHR